MTDLTILMPVFNERDTVVRAVDSALEAELPVDGLELIVVDDGSTDGTTALLNERGWPSGVRLLSHDRNLGKGAALRTGLKEAHGEVTAILDADLEYEAEDIGKLLLPLMDGTSDAVYGVRGFRSHSAYSFWYVMGNRGVTFTANLLFNSWIDDIMTCHKVMRTELFRSLDLRENGFAIEPEITARLLRAGARIYEVPVDYTARGRDSGKKLTAVDGLRVVRTLLRCRVGR